jgi:hypothetical protein
MLIRHDAAVHDLMLPTQLVIRRSTAPPTWRDQPT